MFNRIKKLFNAGHGRSPGSHHVVIDADEHRLDTSKISPNALKVIEKLQQEGFSAFLVGGGIRDLLLEQRPKDFDVATNATPEQTKRLFRNAMIIGRRFRIVHVRFGREIIEVTTFRAHHELSKNHRDAEQSKAGMLLRDNVYGDIASDAVRRDFTINALYYDPATARIYDYTQGLGDLTERSLQIIGDPDERYREDPVRMLRAARFGAKLGFVISPSTAEPIRRLASLLGNVPPARLFEEVLKMMLSGQATATLNLLRDHQLFAELFPGTNYCLEHGGEFEQKFVEQAVINTDKRIRQHKRVTPAFIYAAFLWLPLQAAMRKLVNDDKIPAAEAMQIAAQGIISQQLARTAIPKRFLIPMREIWTLQLRLPKRAGRRAFATLEHPRFRAAYDFLLLREEAGEDMGGLGMWWTRFQDADEELREKMVSEIEGSSKKRRRPRKRRSPAKPQTPE